MNEIVKVGTQINSLEDLRRVAELLAASGYFDAKGSGEMAIAQVATKILAGQEMGYGPFAAVNGIHIIKGNPTTSANLMAAAVKAHPKYDYRVRTMGNDEVSVEFFEGNDSLGISTFTAQEAKSAGTQNMDKFPRNMLFARAMSNGVRWYCPDVFNGNAVYTPEELGDNNTFTVVNDTEGHQQPQIEEQSKHAPRLAKTQQRPPVSVERSPVPDDVAFMDDAEPLSQDAEWDAIPEGSAYTSKANLMWPTDAETLDLCAGLRNSPDCPERVFKMIEYFGGKSVNSDGPMTEKQYNYLAGLVDKRYGGGHNAILSALCEHVVTSENLPGFDVKELLDWMVKPEENASKKALAVLDDMVKFLKVDISQFEVA